MGNASKGSVLIKVFSTFESTKMKAIYQTLVEFYCSIWGVIPLKIPKGIRILCCHDILSRTTFIDCMRFVKQHFKVISLSEAIRKLEDQIDLDEAYLIVTFDDGCRSFLEISESLIQLVIPATLFVTVDYIGKYGYLTWDEITALSSNRLFEIGSHTISHPKLSRCSKERVWYELIRSREIIADRIKQEVDLFAIPYGGEESFTPDVLSMASDAGYRAVATTYRGLNLPSSITLVNNNILVLRRSIFNSKWRVKAINGLLRGAMDLGCPRWPEGIIRDF